MNSYLIFMFLPCAWTIEYFQPEQIHLAYGNTAEKIVITWSTRSRTNFSIVEYGIGALNTRKFGESVSFTDDGDEKRIQYIHKVSLSNLTPGVTYHYHCGNEKGWSAIYHFKTIPQPLNYTLTFAVYGDLGVVNAQALPLLQQEAQRGDYDGVIHVGDFAYNLDTDNGRVGDKFMKQLEPLAAYVPYMTCPGNHEEAYNFSHYRARFSMPGLPDRMFYSYDIGPVHFISINTEVFFNIKYDRLENVLNNLTSQYMWLENDLQEANKLENREKHPWIITYGHRTMYCSDTDDKTCTDEKHILRDGLPVIGGWSIEKLFFNYGVDIAFWGHKHSYERTWPVFEKKVRNGTADDAYTNPKAPVHIKTGIAGAEIRSTGFIEHPDVWSAFRSLDYGYTKLKVYNKTHAYVEQISSEKQGEVIDKIWIIQENHGKYSS